MSKFHQTGEVTFVNPGTDYFNKFGGEANPEFIDKTHSRESYDLVHIHFSFDRLSIFELKNLLDYFEDINKPVVWTCHSRESQRERNIGKGELQMMLYDRSKTIITLTHGCKSWIKDTYGNDKNIEVIPLGCMLNPDTLSLYKRNLDLKKKTNFVYLVGEIRQNKEINLSIKGFIESPELSDCVLTVITKPQSISKDKLNNRTENFWNIIRLSSRIKLISLPEISNEVLAEVFCESHVCMLPYLWGTHSGQVELSRDCGCYPVISDVGFYKEQSDQIVEFNYNDNLSIFTNNFIKALIKAKEMPLLVPNPELRKIEFSSILQKHINTYRSIL